LESRKLSHRSTEVFGPIRSTRRSIWPDHIDAPAFGIVGVIETGCLEGSIQDIKPSLLESKLCRDLG
jgi:hypothetical protein